MNNRPFCHSLFGLCAALGFSTTTWATLDLPRAKPFPEPPDRTLTLRSDNLVKRDGSVGLVVIVHGWRDNIEPTIHNPAFDLTRAYGLTDDGWVPRMANRLRPRLPANWDIWHYDWATDANVIVDNGWNEAAYLKNFKASAKRAPGHGRFLGKIIAGKGYQYVHFISHSLGAEVIEEATIAIKRANGATVVQETFLDGVNRRASYGLRADLADHYLIVGRGRLLGNVGTLYPFAYNQDINNADPYRTLGKGVLGDDPYGANTHRYAREWYELGVSGAFGNPGAEKPPKKCDPVPPSVYNKGGYGLSRECRDQEAAGQDWPSSEFRLYERLRDGIKFDPSIANYVRDRATQVSYFDVPQNPDVTELVTNRTGLVWVTPDTVTNPVTSASGITLTAQGTNVASMVLVLDTSAFPADGSPSGFVNTITFDYMFDGPAYSGWSGLSLLMPDSTGTNWADAFDTFQQLAYIDGGFESAEVVFPPLPPGQYALAFALDAYEGSSSVMITNLQFGLKATAQMLFPDPTITSLAHANGTFQLSFQSAAGCGYVLETADGLAEPIWDASQQVTGDGSVMTFSDTNATAPARFYRVRAQ
jgi:hypothetical protein